MSKATRKSTKRAVSVILSLLLATILAFTLSSCITIGPGGNGGTGGTGNNGNGEGGNGTEQGQNYVIVKGGYLSTGVTRDYFNIGDTITLIAEDLPGVYFDYWTKNGEMVSDSASVYVTTADGEDGAEINFVANYRLSSAASLEDISKGKLTGSFTSDRYILEFNTNSEKVYAEVVEDPDNYRNNVLKFVDSDNTGSGSIRVSTAAVVGDFLVYSVDMLVESVEGAVPFQIQMGNYDIQFYSSGGPLKICDLALGTTAYLQSMLELDGWHNFKVYITNTEIDGKYPHSFILVDGTCVAESYNVSKNSFSDAVTLFTSDQSRAVIYLDNLSSYRSTLSLSEQTAMNPAFVVEKGYVNTDAYYQAELILDEEALAALKAMDDALFSEDIYLWIADLYDPETSALYFSISGRDNYGYLPDIETVAQGYGILSTLGLGGAGTVLNAEQKANLLAWIQTLQSNRDGYYYHPHWGVSINNSRLSRDLGNSGSSYGASGSLAYRLFNDANYRLSGGNSGYKGYVNVSIYDNSLPGRLTYSTSSVSAVSKVIMTSSMSSMPNHLRSEYNLITFINNYWNNTCRVAGTHERHFCTDNCVIVENPSDSYMKFVDGKLVITRGYQCTSCHVCQHSLGHSYSFGHTVTSMGSQIKSVGLGTPTVMYFYDIQENVQASLRDKAEENYIAEHGNDAWQKLTEEQRTAIRRAAENGIWEEKVTYNTISGLLKICGIPGTHGYEFLYAEAAINSAIEGALFSTEDFIARREAIVSIYNPFNAINGIMNNINNYGSDPGVRTEAMALIRSRAKELIDNTAVKLACYLMPDGGYSYNMSGYCEHSQGQPVAINGWNNGVGEGDVNGTALAIGTRGALVSCLGISVGAPFSGDRALYSEEGYDLDCNGTIEGDELQATHTQVFQSIITHKSEIQKVDVSSTASVYDFEGTDPTLPTSGTVVSDGNNKVLSVTDSAPDSGLYTTFLSRQIVGDENVTKIIFDMKVINANNTVTHQIFAGGSNSLYINVTYTDGIFTFTNIGERNHTLTEIGSIMPLTVNAKEWFNVEISIYINKAVINGTSCYGTFAVTQDGVTKTAYLKTLNSTQPIQNLKMYSLNGSLNTVYYDNVSVYTSVVPGVYDGEYHFDTNTQKIVDDLIASPTNEDDIVYPLEGDETAAFTPHDYTGSTVIYNFDFFQGALHLSEMKAGERVYLAYKDSSGKIITGIYLEKQADGTITFYAANGQIIRMTNRNKMSVDDPDVVEMNINADLSKWITVKLEYHYDMESPQFDVVVKYADLDNYSYNKTIASTLVNVGTHDEGAVASDFSSFEVHYKGSADSKICLDDLYIRNVHVK